MQSVVGVAMVPEAILEKLEPMTMTYLFLNNTFYKLEKNQIFMLELQLVIP